MSETYVSKPKKYRVSSGLKKFSPNFSKLTPNELVKRIVANPGDQKAWQEFYNRYHLVIYATVAKICGAERNFGYAEDITQNVYGILIKDNCKALKSFKGEHDNSIFKWLRIIAARETVKCLKSQRSSQPLDNIEMFLEEKNFSDCHFEDLKYKELVEEIDFHLNKLVKGSRYAERDKLIFRLRFFSGLTPEEIATQFSDLSAKRVWGILTELKKGIKRKVALSEPA